MLYKPNFCNNCAEPIEKYGRNSWSSTRFCEHCEPEFRVVDWLPTGGMMVSILIGLFGFGSYLKSPETKLSNPNKAATIVGTSRNANEKNSNTSTPVNQIAVSNSNVANRNIQPKLESTLPRSIVSAETTQNQADETVYFCGAQTKKGNPCTRKVKSASRCWQHVGQRALLPKEKLLASK